MWYVVLDWNMIPRYTKPTLMYHDDVYRLFIERYREEAWPEILISICFNSKFFIVLLK